MVDQPASKLNELKDSEKKELTDELTALLSKFFQDKSIDLESTVVDLSMKSDSKETLSLSTSTSLFCRWGCYSCSGSGPSPTDPCRHWNLCWGCR